MNRFLALAVLFFSAASSVRADAITGSIKDAYVDLRTTTCEGQTSRSAFIYFDIQYGSSLVTVYTNNDSSGKNALSMALTAASTGQSVTVGYTSNASCSGANKMDYLVFNSN